MGIPALSCPLAWWPSLQSRAGGLDYPRGGPHFLALPAAPGTPGLLPASAEPPALTTHTLRISVGRAAASCTDSRGGPLGGSAHGPAEAVLTTWPRGQKAQCWPWEGQAGAANSSWNLSLQH